MFYPKTIAAVCLTLCLGAEALALPSTSLEGSFKQEGPKRELLAANRKAKKGKERILTGEARAKGGKTKIDFDEAQIDGERRTPVGMDISKNRPEHDYDLINLRLRWHPEMIQSTANLETGRGR